VFPSFSMRCIPTTKVRAASSFLATGRDQLGIDSQSDKKTYCIYWKMRKGIKLMHVKRNGCFFGNFQSNHTWVSIHIWWIIRSYGQLFDVYSIFFFVYVCPSLWQ
jgi:hypothetical protein